MKRFVRSVLDKAARLGERAERLCYRLPGGAYGNAWPGDRRAFATVLDVWQPQNERPAVLLRWLITEWCNYACPYCTQRHERWAPKGNMTAHAFDNFPVDRWLEAFARHFAEKRLSLVITGGEPFVDRNAMPVLLSALVAMPSVRCIRIDTNAWWRPDEYAGLDKSKITLMCTLHPSQTSPEKFFAKIDELLDAGFRIGMVNYVMSEDNLPHYLRFRDALAQKGIPLHPNPLWDRAGKYSARQVELLRSELPEPDFMYRSGTASPFAKRCLYPALAYEMKSTGEIRVACHPAVSGSFFGAELPRLFERPVLCPQRSCACLDKYSFLKQINRNTDLDPLKIYGDILRERRSRKSR